MTSLIFDTTQNTKTNETSRTLTDLKKKVDMSSHVDIFAAENTTLLPIYTIAAKTKVQDC